MLKRIIAALFIFCTFLNSFAMDIDVETKAKIMNVFGLKQIEFEYIINGLDKDYIAIDSNLFARLGRANLMLKSVAVDIALISRNPKMKAEGESLKKLYAAGEYGKLEAELKSIFSKSLAVMKTPEDKSVTVSALFATSRLLALQGEYEASLIMYSLTLNNVPDTYKSYYTPKILIDMAAVNEWNGEKSKSEDIYVGLIDTLEKNKMTGSADYIIALVNYGGTQFNDGNSYKASLLFKKAVDAVHKKDPKSPFLVKLRFQYAEALATAMQPDAADELLTFVYSAKKTEDFMFKERYAVDKVSKKIWADAMEDLKKGGNKETFTLLRNKSLRACTMYYGKEAADKCPKD